MNENLFGFKHCSVYESLPKMSCTQKADMWSEFPILILYYCYYYAPRSIKRWGNCLLNPLWSKWSLLNNQHYHGTSFSGVCSNNSLRLYKIHSLVNQCSLLVILPLIGTQLYINLGFDYHLALFNLCFPIVHALILQLARLKHSRIPFLELLQCIPLLSIAYISLTHFKYYGMAVVISYIISFYMIGTTGMIYSTPSKDLFNISIIFANYFTTSVSKGL